jgi:hypothetical protein
MDLLERAPLLDELDGVLATTTTGGRVVLLPGQAGPEGEQLGVPGERLEGAQHVSYGHACSAGNARTLGRDPFGTPLVPAVERREVAGVPDLMEAGVLRSQSRRSSRVTARRSWRRSSVDGRPQNQ